MPSPRGSLKILAPVASSCALPVLGVAYVVVVVWALGLQGESRDLSVFVAGAFLLAPISALIHVFLVRPDVQRPLSSGIEAANCWAAIALLLGLASLPLAIFAGSLGEQFWFRVAPWIVIAVAVLHAAGLVAAGKEIWTAGAPSWLQSRSVQAAAISVGLFVAAMTLFRIEPNNSHLNAAVALFIAPPLFGEGFMVAAVTITAVAAIAVFE